MRVKIMILFIRMRLDEDNTRIKRGKKDEHNIPGTVKLYRKVLTQDCCLWRKLEFEECVREHLRMARY